MNASVFPEPTPTTPDPYRPPQVEAIFRQIRDLVASASPMPLSSSSMVNQEELLAMVDEAISRLPEEVRATHDAQRLESDPRPSVLATGPTDRHLKESEAVLVWIVLQCFRVCLFDCEMSN